MFHRQGRDKDKPLKRITSAAPRAETSTSNLFNQAKRREENCQSENGNKSQMSENSDRLPLLLLKLKLEELGFRAHQYAECLRDIEEIKIREINTHVEAIVNQLLQRGNAPLICPQVSLDHARALQPLPSQKSRQIHPIHCPICLLDFEEGEFKPLSCGHGFCKECLKMHIMSCIQEANYNIQCLQEYCPEVLHDSIILQIIGQSLYDKYSYFRSKRNLERNPDNKFCSVPNCEGILQPKDQGDALFCFVCKSEYCLTCLRGRHDGDCSSEIEQILERAYQQHNIKKCPSCHAPIQKVDGCNHMSCRHCSFQFCWLCLGKYSSSHYQYYNCCGCPGMQFESEEERCCQKLKQALVFVLIPPVLILIVLTVSALLPFYMMIMALIKPFEKAMELKCLSNCCVIDCCDTRCSDCIDDDDCDCCENVGNSKLNLVHVLVGFILLPYGLFYALFIAPIKFLLLSYQVLFDILE